MYGHAMNHEWLCPLWAQQQAMIGWWFYMARTAKEGGDAWGRLAGAYTAKRTFRSRVLHDPSGEGTTRVDDAYAEAYFDEIGAEIMGAGMFGFHSFPDDPDWRGWWGEEPPYHTPVFVLTHHPRAPLKMKGAPSSTSSLQA